MTTMACWFCFANDLRPSLPRWYDAVLLLLGREPYRCRVCGGRQWQRATPAPVQQRATVTPITVIPPATLDAFSSEPSKPGFASAEEAWREPIWNREEPMKRSAGNTW